MGGFKEFEHAGWQSASAGYHDHFGALTQQAIEPLLDAASVTEDRRVLDVATGPGYVASAAAARGARVLGIDFADEQVALARQLVPDVDFRQDDAENLSFDNGAFDAVVMNFGLLHLSAPEKALAEARRVLREGGRIAFTVWSVPAKAVGFGMILDAIQKHGDMEVPLPEGPPFFRFSEPAECERCLDEAGFADVRGQDLPMTWLLPSPETAMAAFESGTVRTAALLAAQEPPVRAAIADAVREATLAYEKAGAFHVPMSAALTSATAA